MRSNLVSSRNLATQLGLAAQGKAVRTLNYFRVVLGNVPEEWIFKVVTLYIINCDQSHKKKAPVLF